MRLFLDTSVVLAACGSRTGASRAIFDRAQSENWTLLTSSYVLEETTVNLSSMGLEAEQTWPHFRSALLQVDDVVSFAWPILSVPAKDRPILFTAAAWSDVLLTLDRHDFGTLLGSDFYGLHVMKPGDFLKMESDGERRFQARAE